MENECPYYQGVCGIDNQYVCFCRSNLKCNIRVEYEKKLDEEIKKQYKPTGMNIYELID